MKKNFSNIKAVFFDMDGTLVYQQVPFEERVNQALKQVGIKISTKETLKLIKKCMLWFWQNNVRFKGDTQGLYFEFLKLCVSETKKVKTEEVDTVAAKIGLILKEMGDMSKLYEDSIPVLKKLKESNYRLGCVSGRDYKLHKAVEKYNIAQYFEYVVSTTDANANKSDPALYICACKKFNLQPEYILHIGDYYEGDILGAVAANINAVLIDRDNRYDGQNLNCIVVNDLYGLLEILKIKN